MEFRAWVTVPDLPVEAEQLWQPLMAHLENEFAEFGPIVGWSGDTAEIVLSTDAPSEAVAARDLYHAVADSLRAQGLVHRYPTAVKVELVEDPVPAAA